MNVLLVVMDEPPVPVSVLEIKALVRHRDGYCCTECGMSAAEHIKLHGRTLDVHRIIPGTNYTMAGSQTLCKKCHRTKPKSPRGCRPRRGGFNVRLKGVLCQQLFILAERNHMTPRELVRAALRKVLAEEGLWPPPPKPS